MGGPTAPYHSLPIRRHLHTERLTIGNLLLAGLRVHLRSEEVPMRAIRKPAHPRAIREPAHPRAICEPSASHPRASPSASHSQLIREPSKTLPAQDQSTTRPIRDPFKKQLAGNTLTTKRIHDPPASHLLTHWHNPQHTHNTAKLSWVPLTAACHDCEIV